MNYKKMRPLANECGAVQTKKFEQSWYIASLPFDAAVQNGVCRALSAAYLVRNFSRAIDNFEEVHNLDFEKAAQFGNQKFFEAFHDKPHQSETDMERWKKISRVQSKYAKSGQMSKDELIDAAKWSVSDLSNKMLQFMVDTPVCVSGEGVTQKALPDEAGYWLLSAGGHMMATVIRKNMKGTKAKFFDPNAGQALFEDIEKLRKFLKKYSVEEKYDPVFFIRFKC